jgi:cytochrome P450
LKLLTGATKIQRNLRYTLRAAIPAAVFENRLPLVDEILHADIPYLDATIEETLRCGTPVANVTRETTVDTELLGRLIPRGTTVIVACSGPGILTPAMYIDEATRSATARLAKAEGRFRAWDDEAIDTFKPERWLVPKYAGHDETVDGSLSRLVFDSTAGPHLAFGLGKRGCFGRRLGYLEMRIILVLLIWRFELLPCPESLVDYDAVEGITHKPKNCYVRLQKVVD